MAGEFEELIETRKLKLAAATPSGWLYEPESRSRGLLIPQDLKSTFWGENGEEEIPTVRPHRPIEAQRSALLETPSRQPSSLDMQHAAA
jgi:hypothetical protein